MSSASNWRRLGRIREFLSKVHWITLLSGVFFGLPLWVLLFILITGSNPQNLAFWELVLGVILGGIVGWVLPEFIERQRFHWQKLSPIRKVLGSTANNSTPTVIFVAPLYPHNPDAFHKCVPLKPGGTMEIFPKPRLPWMVVENDAKALGYTMALLSKAGKTEEISLVRDDLGLEMSSVDMICIGGILSNYKTGQIHEAFQNLPFTFEQDEIEIIIRADGRTWRNDNVHDYAILAKVPNEYDRSKCVLIIAGISHPGTGGAAHYLSTKWDEIAPRMVGNSFALVIKVRKDNIQFNQLEHAVTIFPNNN